MEEAARLVDAVRDRRPLVHCITNYVTVTDCANILLAAGASPAMCDDTAEAVDFAGLAGALYINLGTFRAEHKAAIFGAGHTASAKGIPVVVDPAGCAAIPSRVTLLEELAGAVGITIVKGNIAEIFAAAGVGTAGATGVDSVSEAAGVDEAVKRVTERFHCVTAATGKVDVVTDGETLVKIANGVPMLKTITGAGCMAGALCAAYAACASRSPLAATVAGVAVMGVAGEMAFEKARTPGGFHTALFDSIYEVTGDTLRDRGRIQC
jgi:hydroxyethylthiazole kinase